LSDIGCSLMATRFVCFLRLQRHFSVFYGVFCMFSARRRASPELFFLSWLRSLFLPGVCWTNRCGDTNRVVGKRTGARHSATRLRFPSQYFSGCLFYFPLSVQYSRDGIMATNSAGVAGSRFSPVCFLCPVHREEEAADEAGEYQYGNIRRASAGAGNRPGHGPKNTADAQVVWAIQKRRRLAGHSRPRPKAFRQNAQVPNSRTTRSEEDSSDLGCSPKPRWQETAIILSVAVFRSEGLIVDDSQVAIRYGAS